MLPVTHEVLSWVHRWVHDGGNGRSGAKVNDSHRWPAYRVTVFDVGVVVKKLDVKVGDLVEIGERRYDVVSDKAGGVALERVITKTLDRLHAERKGRPLSTDEFDQHFGQRPTDGEG